MDNNDGIVEYLLELSKMSFDELKNEIINYKKVIDDLYKGSNREHFLYNCYLSLFKVLNVFSGNSYDPIIREIKSLKYDTLYEKEALSIMRLVKKYLVRTNNYNDIDCFYLTLVAITKLHNDRYLYSNNLYDMYSSNLRGISVQLPNPIDYDNRELKDSIDESLNILVKKIE